MSELKTINMTEEIEAYLKRGFGSMNKNDFEVWIFHYLMMQDRYKDKNDFDMSIELKIPETKVKRLRYEAELRYTQSTENERRQKLKEAISQAYFKRKDGNIAFVIDEKMLRSYLQNFLRNDHRYYDSSFMSNIVIVSPDDFIYILDNLVLSKEERKEIIAKAKKYMTDADRQLPTTLIEVVGDSAKGFCTEFLSTFVGKAADSLVDHVWKSIKASVNKTE